MDRVKRLALVSIAVGLGVLALKYAAYHITGSVALYSDALESIVNVAAAVAALLAIRLSAKPPDRNNAQYRRIVARHERMPPWNVTPDSLESHERIYRYA